jgi:uncharacterized membrane protein
VLNLLLLILNYSQDLFWLKFLVALILISVLYLFVKYGLRRLKYKDKDLKNAGLNHQGRRQWRAVERRKFKHRGRSRKMTKHHF